MKNQKNAFTIIEIALVISILSVLYVTMIPYMQNRAYMNKVDDFIKKLIVIKNEAIYDPIKGYVSEIGGECSNSYNVKNISALRVKNCSNNDSIPTIKTDSIDSYMYFSDLQCKVYLYNVNKTSFLDWLIDCSKVDELKREALELKIESEFKRDSLSFFKLSNFKSTKKSVYDSTDNVNDFNPNTPKNGDFIADDESGTVSDGKLLLRTYK